MTKIYTKIWTNLKKNQPEKSDDQSFHGKEQKGENPGGLETVTPTL